MKLSVFYRIKGEPRELKGEWDAVPRIGEMVVIPAIAGDREFSGRVTDVTWYPDSSPGTRASVQLEDEVYYPKL